MTGSATVNARHRHRHHHHHHHHLTEHVLDIRAAAESLSFRTTMNTISAPLWRSCISGAVYKCHDLLLTYLLTYYLTHHHHHHHHHHQTPVL